MPPMHLWLMHHPILACVPTNGYQQLVQYALSIPHKKAQVLSCIHAQNEAQIDHP